MLCSVFVLLLFHTCSCMEHTSSFYLCVLPPFFRILFPSFLLLSCCHPLILSHLACLHPVIPFFDSFLFSHFNHPSSPSFHISTSDEQWGGDCSASLCSHFMVWLKNWDRRKVMQRGENRDEYQESVKKAKFEAKKNKKGMKKGTG